MIKILAGNVVVHASAAVAPAIALSLLLRRVGFGEFGQVLAYQTLVALFVGVSDLGCSIRGLQRLAKQHHTRGLAAAGRSARLFLSFRCTSAILAGVALLGYLALFKRSDPRIIVPTLVLYFAQALTPSWALLAVEAMAKITVEVVVTRALWVALTIAVVREGLTYLWLVALLNVVLAVVTVRQLRRELGDAPVVRAMPWRRFGRTFRANAGFSLSRLAVNVYQSAPLLIMSQVASSAAVGVYATIETVHKVYATASFPITDALFGRTSRTRSPRAFLQYGVPLLLAILGSIAAVAAGAPWVLAVIGGGKAAGAAPQLRLILVATALSVTSIFVGYPLAGGLGFTRAVNRTTFASPVAIFAVFPVAYSLLHDAVLAAVAALVCTEAIVLVLRLAVVRQALGDESCMAAAEGVSAEEAA